MKKYYCLLLAAIIVAASSCGAAFIRGGPVPQPLTSQELDAAREITLGLEESRFLDGVHHSNGVACIDCHGVETPGWDDAAESGDCLKCHESREALAAAVDQDLVRKWGNPHDSHLGAVDCGVCHKAHEASSVYCLGCHIDAPFNISGQ